MSTSMLDQEKALDQEGNEVPSALESRRVFNFSPWVELPPAESTARLDPEIANGGVGPLERAAAVLLVLLSSPVLLLVALAVKIDSPGGPILFRQERVGLDRRRSVAPSPGEGGADRRKTPGAGRLFYMYKFRTMVPDAEKTTGPIWASKTDPRITRVGRVLRHLRVDEVPQLFNVVAGQMRLIGPRPERPHFVSRLSREIPGYSERLKVPPGITGLAQVEKEYDATVDHVRTKLKYDLFYVHNRCNLLDLKIMVKTVDVMLRGRGAR